MKPKLYLETTIPSYLVGWPSRDLVAAAKQQITHEWWKRRRHEFDLYTSEFVVREVSRGNRQLAEQRLALLEGVVMLPVTLEIIQVATDLVAKGPVPRKMADDAAHIAVAAAYGCDYLLTWDCRHIANAEMHSSIQRVIERYHGYELPILCTPQELMGDDNGVEG